MPVDKNHIFKANKSYASPLSFAPINLIFFYLLAESLIAKDM